MLQKCSVWVVASVFFREPSSKHTLIDVSRKAKLAHTSVKKHLQTLLKEKLIVREDEKKQTRVFPVYEANKEHANYLFYKQIFNKEQLQKSKLIEKLVETYQPQAIILYGSYARGEDNETSDIDIFVDTANKKEIPIQTIEKKLKKRIDLKVNTFENLPEELQNNILNGVTLYGFVEVGRVAKSTSR